MKRIGIIGGMAPESTQLYYKYIIEEARKRLGDHNYPEIIIYSVNFQKFINWMKNGAWRNVADALVDIIYRLRDAGADFALIATNTMHIVFDEVSRRSPIPLLSIIDAVADEILKCNIKIVGLLGTRYTMTEDFYKVRLNKLGIEVIIPPSDDIDLVHYIIFEELVKGIIRDKSKSELLRIIKGFEKEGAGGVILGCTEIPMIITQEDVNIKLFDTTKIHAVKALEYALNK